jgi:DNA repair exonuclease SbcCD ATPase subunit
MNAGEEASPDRLGEVSLQSVVSALQARGDRCCAPVVSLLPASRAGSRRRRLWELNGHAHCPVVGLCLPVSLVRRLVTKALGLADEDDYVLHCDAVAAAQHRTLIAEALQRELERRHAPQVRSVAALKTQDDLRLWWQTQRYEPGIAGALWAILTHPRCTPGLERRVLADVHMQQHELGQNLRAQGDRLIGLQKANVELVQEKTQLQNRVDVTMRQLTQQRETLTAELMRLRGQLLVKDATITGLQDELRELRRAQPGLPQRKALAEQVANQNEQLRDLQRE